ncbi:MAG: SMI1/KNR4 family protein [Woeseiaceae bacterium]|nr:SMI1/KNR4 family protein [Woeseiaceae bacterium]
MTTLQDSWQQLLSWFGEHRPETITALRAPASDNDLDAFSAAIGLGLPDDHRALYRLADGSDLDVPSVLDDGHWFFPLEEALNHFNTMKSFADAKPVDDFARWREEIEDTVITVEGPVKPHPFSVQWIPLSSSNGDVHRYIDLDPAPGGIAGQVIEVYPEACSHRVLANSITEYLADYVAGLQVGEFVLEHECMTRREPPADAIGVLPDYLKNATAEELAAPAVAPTGPDTIVGDMGSLAGSDEDVFFTLHSDDGAEFACVATRQDTAGFSNIGVEQRARVSLRPCKRRRFLFLKKADYLVLEYKVEPRPAGQ